VCVCVVKIYLRKVTHLEYEHAANVTTIKNTNNQEFGVCTCVRVCVRVYVYTYMCVCMCAYEHSIIL